MPDSFGWWTLQPCSCLLSGIRPLRQGTAPAQTPLCLDFTAAIALDDKNIGYYRNRSQAHDALGHTARAQADPDQAASLST